MKKDHHVLKLILSVVSLMIGVVWTGAAIIVLGSMGTDVPMWRIVVLLAFSALFLFLGIRGLLRQIRLKQEEKKKIGKAVPIILSIVGALLLLQMAMTFPIMIKNGKLHKALKPYVKEEFSEDNAEIPEDPWFVFYHNGNFSVPSRRFVRGTDDPDKVNVVVLYTDSVSRNGAWVDNATGKKVSDANVQHVTLSVVRLEDWALIDEVSFSLQLKQGENGVNPLGMSSVESYLNELGK